MQLSAPAAVQLTLSLDFSNNDAPSPEPLNAGRDCFDAETITCVEGLVNAVVRPPHSQQEREDCLQEALLGFWQAMRKEPGQPRVLYLARCRSSIRHSLNHGKSVDSPKRRWLGYSIDSREDEPTPQSLPELASDVDPLQQASASDALAQMYARLNKCDQTILNLFLEGNGTREVARQLNMSPSGVGKSHVRIRLIAARLGLSPTSSRTKEKEK